MDTTTASLLFAAVIGFGHAFEADHLVAVSNIVTRRERPLLAIRDGIFWGLGHSSTIFLVGLLIIVGKMTLLSHYLVYFEAVVGLMLITLGIIRLRKLILFYQEPQTLTDDPPHHHLAYGVGLIHGLAGSGAMVLLVMSEIPDSGFSLLYLLIFGLGSVAGMLCAAGALSLPFSQKLAQNLHIKSSLVILSSLLCLGYGSWMLYTHV